MKEIICPLEKFDFKGFIKDMYSFAEKIVDPDYVTAWVNALGKEPEYEPAKNEAELLAMLRDENKLLFFQFSNVNIGDPILCADGREYEVDEDSDFCLGDADCIGYVFKYHDGSLVINSAVNASGACPAPPPSIDLEPECDIFDNPMEVFINKYIKK